MRETNIQILGGVFNELKGSINPESHNMMRAELFLDWVGSDMEKLERDNNLLYRELELTKQRLNAANGLLEIERARSTGLNQTLSSIINFLREVNWVCSFLTKSHVEAIVTPEYNPRVWIKDFVANVRQIGAKAADIVKAVDGSPYENTEV